MLPISELLAGANHPEALGAVLQLANLSLRTFQPQWSGFLTAPEREECLDRLATLVELQVVSNGGFPLAERQRLHLARSQDHLISEAAIKSPAEEIPLKLLEISGNFLFDPAVAHDFRAALLQEGLKEIELGDALVRGDRGALIVVSPETGEAMIGKPLQVRTVPCQVVEASWERLPRETPKQKQITTVEASLRLDAVASAGFAISRNRMAVLIRQGKVRINWKVITNPSRELKILERVQLEGRGELQLAEALLTKRERWRLSLLRTL
jgi:photosystem II S4 domain protein